MFCDSCDSFVNGFIYARMYIEFLKNCRNPRNPCNALIFKDNFMRLFAMFAMVFIVTPRHVGAGHRYILPARPA